MKTAVEKIPVVKIPEFPELEFDEVKHQYRLGGRILPSVTSLMGPLSSNLYQDISEDVLNRAAERGTAVHQAIENYFKFGVDDVTEEYEAYYEAFKKWCGDNEVECLGSECRIYHKLFQYAGTADMPAMVNGQRILVDFKCSASVNRMLTGVQLEAYAKAFESHGVEFEGKEILHLRKDGKYEEVKYPKHDSESWSTFGALLTIHNHIQKYSKK